MSFDRTICKAASELNPISLAKSAFSSAIEQPWNAVAQLTDGTLPSLHITDSKPTNTLASKAGSIIGTVLDFAVLSKATSGALDPLLAESKATVGASALKSGISGALYGGVFTSSAPGQNPFLGRLTNATDSALTFAAMGGASQSLASQA